MSAKISKKNYILGCIELTLAQCCVGFNVISGKFLIAYLPVFLMLTIRFAIGVIGMLIIARFKHINYLSIYTTFIKLAFKDKMLLIFQALCGGFLFNVLILYGMKTTSATSAGIITSITPVMIFILAAIFLHEKMTLQKILAINLVMIGLLILNTSKISNATQVSFWGNCLVFLAVIPEALFTIFSKTVGNKIPEVEAVILVNFFNFIFFVPFCIVDMVNFHFLNLGINIYIHLLIYGISGGIMFFLLWYRGLTKINANTAALFTGVMPISTTILAFVFLNEPIHFDEIIGMLFVISAIFIGSSKHSIFKTNLYKTKI